MEIQLPSPSVFLRRSPALNHSPSIEGNNSSNSKTNTKIEDSIRHTAVSTASSASSGSNGIEKPKQSKSRNGCVTCKQKRLKCDETKPSCIQCQKRSVYCEGYKKDFKWRTFEETTQTSKSSRARKTQNNVSQPAWDDTTARSPSFASPTSPTGQERPNTLELHYAFTSATQAFLDSDAVTGFQDVRRSPATSYTSYNQFTPATSHFSPLQLSSGPPQSHSRQHHHRQLSRHLHYQQQEDIHRPASFSVKTPPMLADLCAPGTDFHSPPDSSELRPPPSPHPYSPDPPGLYPAGETKSEESGEDSEEADEEIARASCQDSSQAQSGASRDDILIHATSPARSVASSSSSSSSGSARLILPRSPQQCPASSDALIYRFSIQTSGILSVRNGKTENPWRELIWPLAKDCPALFHAITYMSALQGAQYDKQSRGGRQVQLLKIAGFRHMQQSIKKLYEGLKTMSLDAALATSLALALGEGWDDNPSTGILHLKGAKLLIQNALMHGGRSLALDHWNAENARRLKFLCNTFVYLDVIARLTSKEPQDDFDFAALLTAGSQASNTKSIEVDPLMGCATDLFPIIGEVATLIQKVRDPGSRLNLLIIEEAGRLKEALERWQAPHADHVETPEDPDLAVQDAIHTAESYRLATLLYLY